MKADQSRELQAWRDARHRITRASDAADNENLALPIFEFIIWDIIQ